ncbi:hypothetical protein [Rhodococcus maanshanensis]|uniref:Uncharacterized protein n=1 Tax=Rhodococcus maanshanensis TaxID=183556 RepID=A0A1H7Q8N4_9NOCA|nr:hypothetical protein [Rhodococcus maanshanensis]SEL43667.1 hypothetical protein SAMN05444583_10959 [Rhodococcus maanshanensis]
MEILLVLACGPIIMAAIYLAIGVVYYVELRRLDRSRAAVNATPQPSGCQPSQRLADLRRADGRRAPAGRGNRPRTSSRREPVTTSA